MLTHVEVLDLTELYVFHITDKVHIYRMHAIGANPRSLAADAIKFWMIGFPSATIKSSETTDSCQSRQAKQYIHALIPPVGHLNLVLAEVKAGHTSFLSPVKWILVQGPKVFSCLPSIYLSNITSDIFYFDERGVETVLWCPGFYQFTLLHNERLMMGI